MRKTLVKEKVYNYQKCNLYINLYSLDIRNNLCNLVFMCRLLFQLAKPFLYAKFVQ